jgi:multisubunit Na+/H+ antiporter MnhC subunit
MQLLIALTIGFLVAAGLYRLLGRTKIDTLIGLILLSQGANLTIFAAGGLRHNAPALLDGRDTSLMTDPLPQALVLTAIVIGFGILAFLLTLVLRSSSR